MMDKEKKQEKIDFEFYVLNLSFNFHPPDHPYRAYCLYPRRRRRLRLNNLSGLNGRKPFCLRPKFAKRACKRSVDRPKER